jgi:hypothetical protein
MSQPSRTILANAHPPNAKVVTGRDHRSRPAPNAAWRSLSAMGSAEWLLGRHG